jgi:hypothetical protein
VGGVAFTVKVVGPGGVTAEVVEMVSVVVLELSEPAKTTGLGENVALAPAGSPVMVGVALNPPPPLPERVKVTVYVAELPAHTGKGDCAPTVTVPTWAASVKVV